ncbi:flippase [Halarchaeum sp. P4]|uniref:flippase n=1 Tax=Halarchaeum sp. P4 TaxID=3421639 RepID=UPI003EC0289A
MASLLRSVFSIFSGRFTTTLIGAVFTPILVRLLSQQEYGLFAGIMAGVTIYATISKGGLFDATRKTVAQYDENNVLGAVTGSFTLSILYGIMASALIIISLLIGIIPDIYIDYIPVLILSIISGNLFSVSKGYFYGRQKEHIGELLNVLRIGTYSVSAIILAVLGFGLMGVFAGYTLSFIVSCVVGILLLISYRRESLRSTRPSLEDISTISTYGGYQLIGGLSALLLYKTDILLVQFFRGQGATALYQSAIIPAEMIWVVPAAIQAAFLQSAASDWAADNIKSINNSIKAGTKYCILSLSLFGFGLFTLSPSFVTLYFGPEYADSATALQILILGTFVMGITRPINAVLQATGWVRHTEIAAAIILGSNIIFNLLLIPRYGIMGAAVGTSLSYIFMFVVKIYLWRISTFDVLSGWWWSRIFSVQLAYFMTFYFIVSSVSLSPALSIAVFPPVGLAIFMIFNISAGYIPLSQVRSLVARR